MTLAAIAAPQLVTAAVDPPSPASGHAEVVAQGVVAFDAGPVHWLVATDPIGTTDTDVDDSAPAFVMAPGPGSIVVSDGATPIARLAPGEATFRPAGVATTVRTLAGTVNGTFISLLPGSGDPESTFTPGPGDRDVDLVRDVLGTNEVLVLDAAVSALVVVVSGAVESAGAALTAGVPATLSGDVALINASPQPAVVVVAVVGPLLSGAAPVTSTTVPAPSSGATPSPGTTPSVPAPTTTQSPDDVDSDGDGLSDADEIADGTDPNSVDTDTDGLNDSEERQHATDPLDNDTDDDQLSDGYEVNSSGSDPTRPDTDGDGLQDNEEDGITRTDPRIPDHDNDGDGLWSTFETAIGTDPDNPDTDGDQMFDGYELQHSFSDPLDADTDDDGVPDNVDNESCNPNKADGDGDGLTDGEELNEYHTNCRVADTDGNGQNDPL